LSLDCEAEKAVSVLVIDALSASNVLV
jgi:hypothetical protein